MISSWALSLTWMTWSLLFKVALIASSVCTNLSSSTFKSLFYPPSTLQCAFKASISAFVSWFLSRRLLLLNLMLSCSLRVRANWSSAALSLYSLSNACYYSSLPLKSSFSEVLCKSDFCANYPSRFLWRDCPSTINLECSSLVLPKSAIAASRLSFVLLSSNSFESASFDNSLALSCALKRS